ncbi:MAG: hypothetical protein OEW21_04250 [Betaproteobacteria bacterium]|nr:hypothetical protein [Betaproteobacteria bacterium]
MKTQLIAAVFAATAAQQSFAFDQNVPQSFDRMFNHEPYAGATVTRIDADVDVLAQQIYAAVRAPLPQAAESPNAAYASQADGSFARMLQHTPYAGPTEARYLAGRKDAVERAVWTALRSQNLEDALLLVQLNPGSRDE